MTPRQQFRRFRKKFKVTQKQLAIALGISVRAVKYIEAGRNKPGYRTWEKFAMMRGPLKHSARVTGS